MAITDDVLALVARDGYGPLSLQGGSGSYTASLGNQRAQVVAKDTTLELSASAGASFPDNMTNAMVGSRVQSALGRIAIERPELLVLSGNPGAGNVEAKLWLDRESSTAHDLAVAVRNITAVAAIGALAVGDVRLELMTEEQMLAESQALFEQFEQFEQSKGAPSAPENPPPAPAPGPAPTFLPEPVVASPSIQVAANTTMVDHDRNNVGELVPGTWYRVTDEQGGWMGVVGDDGTEGWIAASAVAKRN